VIISFDATATAKNGIPYRNTYTWYFQMKKEGKVTRRLLEGLVKGRCHEGKSVTGQRSNQLNHVPSCFSYG